jgi:hypothetical protein
MHLACHCSVILLQVNLGYVGLIFMAVNAFYFRFFHGDNYSAIIAADCTSMDLHSR